MHTQPLPRSGCWGFRGVHRTGKVPSVAKEGARVNSVRASAFTGKLVEGSHVHRNLSTPQLVEAAIARGEASLADNGALVALTGARSGRSPRDKFIVRDAVTSDTVDWGKVNQPFDPAQFEALLT